MSFEDLIRAQHQLQVDSFDVDPVALEGDERAEYIRWNVLALTDELHEMLAECGWKPWATDRSVNETEAFAELVDALHFFMNLLMAVSPRGSDPLEIAFLLKEGYAAKHDINAERQAEGYTGLDKCPNCKRDRKTTQRTAEGGMQYCPCGFIYEG